MGFSQFVAHGAFELLARQGTDPDDDEAPDAGQKEIYISWALLILIVLLIAAFLTSYYLQSKRIQAVHETVMSIFAGMVIGLILRLTGITSVREAVTFDSGFFFNLLLPPIILASGYELHQANFFRNIGTILTFAFAGTFISALVLGVILWLWTRIPLEGLNITFTEAMSVGATLSATDPVTILAIFNSYKVDPKLYTIIFGESILNDAIAIVLFQTAQKYTDGDVAGKLTILSLFESIGVFLLVFFGSLLIGIIYGLATSLLLKLTHVRREPKIESCLIILIAYASYFFANAIYMSGIVSLLFCGICLKHYAYHNMSRRTQLTTKFTFSLISQLAENFIFIYLGISLFTTDSLEFKPLFILITILGICAARWCAVFPLSSLINWVIRYRAKRRGAVDTGTEELPGNWQMMLFWAGLRGAVGVALAAEIKGTKSDALRATILVTVVLTVIIFGGTTARMLEILKIRTGVVEEIDSDDEFDIEHVPHASGAYSRKNGTAFGNNPKFASSSNNLNSNNSYDLNRVSSQRRNTASYSSGTINGSPLIAPDLERRNSSRARRSGGPSGSSDPQNAAEQGLLASDDPSISSVDPLDDLNDYSHYDEDDIDDDLGLPPAARRSAQNPLLAQTSRPAPSDHASAAHGSGSTGAATSASLTARNAISQFFNATSEDAGSLFSKLDENFLKPHLLLDPNAGSHGGAGNGNGPSGAGDV